VAEWSCSITEGEETIFTLEDKDYLLIKAIQDLTNQYEEVSKQIMVAVLATEAQVLLAIGEGASANQISSGNVLIWSLMAESDMESVASNGG